MIFTQRDTYIRVVLNIFWKTKLNPTYLLFLILFFSLGFQHIFIACYYIISLHLYKLITSYVFYSLYIYVFLFALLTIVNIFTVHILLPSIISVFKSLICLIIPYYSFIAYHVGVKLWAVVRIPFFWLASVASIRPKFYRANILEGP